MEAKQLLHHLMKYFLQFENHIELLAHLQNQ